MIATVHFGVDKSVIKVVKLLRRAYVIILAVGFTLFLHTEPLLLVIICNTEVVNR